MSGVAMMVGLNACLVGLAVYSLYTFNFVLPAELAGIREELRAHREAVARREPAWARGGPRAE